MKKNNQYVGVDEKYIPEEDKYVDETKSSTDGLNDKINEGIDKAKPYAKKGLNIAKKIGIGYLVYVGIIFLIVIIIFITIIVTFFKMSKRSDDIINSSQNNITEIEKEVYNDKFEFYSGTISKYMVSSLIDTVVTNNKKDTDHLIVVIFNDISTIDTDKIIDIKKSLDDNKDYEVELDYSNSGYVNKVTIEEN